MLLYYKKKIRTNGAYTQKKKASEAISNPQRIVRCQTARSFCGNDLVQVRNRNPRAGTSSGWMLIELVGGVREDRQRGSSHGQIGHGEQQQPAANRPPGAND